MAEFVWNFILDYLTRLYIHSKYYLQALNPKVVVDQEASCKTEMDSIAQFIEQECSLEADTKYPAAKLYEAYRHHCQAIGLKPQSTNAF